MTQRFHYIDRLKGIAILFVILGHYVIFVLHQKDIVLELIGSFHMPLFMFLSGFVIKEIPKTFKMIKKVVALLMPFIIVGFLYMLFIGEPIKEFLWSPFKAGYWYLYVLAVFYMLLQLLRTVESGWGKMCVAILIYVSLNVLNSYVHGNLNGLLSLWVIRQYWPFFILGFFFRFYDISGWISRNNWAFSLALLLYVVGFIFYENGNGHLFYPTAFSFILFVSYLFIRREHCNTFFDRQLGFIGCHTLDIYIYHFFFIQMTHLNGVGVWFAETGNVFLEVLLGIAFSVAVAYMSVGVGEILRKSRLYNEIVYGEFVTRFFKGKKTCNSL